MRFRGRDGFVLFWERSPPQAKSPEDREHLASTRTKRRLFVMNVSRFGLILTHLSETPWGDCTPILSQNMALWFCPDLGPPRNYLPIIPVLNTDQPGTLRARPPRVAAQREEKRQLSARALMRKNGFPTEARGSASARGRGTASRTIAPTSDNPAHSAGQDRCDGDLVRRLCADETVYLSSDGLIKACGERSWRIMLEEEERMTYQDATRS